MNSKIFKKGEIKYEYQTEGKILTAPMTSIFYQPIYFDALIISKLSNYEIIRSYFEGLNSMGLRFERTRPVRVVSRPDPKTSEMVREK